MITLQFSSTFDWESRAIGFLTRSWASRVEVVFADACLIGSLPPRGVCLHSHPAGGYRRVERYRVMVPAAPVYRFLRRQLGKPFDWGAVLGWPRRHWRAAGSWSGAELIAAAFEAAGTPLLRAPGRSRRRITARDLLLSPRLRPFPQASLRPLASAA